MVTLINELLYKGNDRTILKTYCPERHHFGLTMQTPVGTKELRPDLAHVFDFWEKDRCAVVNKAGEYKWVHLDLSIHSMAPSEENMLSFLHMRNSLCNCYKALAPTYCSMCSKGIIRNPLNFRKIEGEINLVFEFETEKGTYRIIMEEKQSISTSIDHLWSITDLENNCQEVIEHYEAAEVDFNQMELKVCIHEHGSGELHRQILLKGYSLEIKLTDIGISLSTSKNKIYLDLF